MRCLVSPCSREAEFDVTFVDENKLGGDTTVPFCRFHAMPLISGRGGPVRYERR